jgi:hypothetical protein
VGDNRGVDFIAWVLPLWTLLVQAGDLGAEDVWYVIRKETNRTYGIRHGVAEMHTGVTEANAGE